eukprot:m.53944 g.53944  ORF g.53944 m.53944 type:complete len:51 (+) comp21841_c0_seq1:99-251(+)
MRKYNNIQTLKTTNHPNTEYYNDNNYIPHEITATYQNNTAPSTSARNHCF